MAAPQARRATWFQGLGAARPTTTSRPVPVRTPPSQVAGSSAPALAVALALALALFLAGSAAGHFHDGLRVSSHDLQLTLELASLHAEEVFTLHAQQDELYEGRVWAWVPARATVVAFGPVATEEGTSASDANASAPPFDDPEAGGGDATDPRDLRLVAFDLAAHNRSIAPDTPLMVGLAWTHQAPGAEGIERGVVYATEALRVDAGPGLRTNRGTAPGPAGFGDTVAIRPAGEEAAGPGLAVEGWHVLVALFVVLLAGAWWWDHRRKRNT